jgi:hypothetical protein
MNIFEEYLDDWEFDLRWRPFVARLAEHTSQLGPGGEFLEECAIWPIVYPGEDPASWMQAPIVIWRDVLRPIGKGGVSLGAVLRDDSIACGTVYGGGPDDLDQADLSWASYRLAVGESSGVLADFFADWLLGEMAVSVDELIERRTAHIRARSGRRKGSHARLEACVHPPPLPRRKARRREIRRFVTSTSVLLKFRDSLSESKIASAVPEATGGYWCGVF